MASPRDILRFIAEREALPATLARFPEVSSAELTRVLLEAAASASAASAPSPAPTTPVSPPVAPPPRAQALRKARLYSDGASRGNPGLAGAGAVILDEQGKPIEKLKRFLGKQTNNVAEYEALLLGLRRALELGVKELEVLADSQLMIRQLDGQYRVKNEGIKPLHHAATQLLKGFERVTLTHVPREQNTAADEMSNRAIDER